MRLDVLSEGAYEPADFVAALRADPLTTTSVSLAVARCLGVVARLGLFTELAAQPVSVDQLAYRFGLADGPLRMTLDVLVNERYLQRDDDLYEVAPAARRWLDPESPTSVTTALSSMLDYWDCWAELDQVVAGGAIQKPAPDPDDETGWLRRVRGQFEWARCIGDEVANAIELPVQASEVLELGDAHGWYAAVLCQRNPMLRATVIGDAAGVVIGREVIWEAGLERVVTHRGGDALTSDLGGPYDAVLFSPQLLAGLDHDQIRQLLARARAVLRPGGQLVGLQGRRDALNTLDADQTVPAGAAWHQLFLRLSSRFDPQSPAQLRELLRTKNFGVPRVQQLASSPSLSVFVARAL